MAQAPVFPDKRERNDFFIALVVIALCGMGIYFVTFGDRDDDDIRLVEQVTEVIDVPESLRNEPEITPVAAPRSRRGRRLAREDIATAVPMEVAVVRPIDQTAVVSPAHIDAANAANQPGIVAPTISQPERPEVKSPTGLQPQNPRVNANRQTEVALQQNTTPITATPEEASSELAIQNARINANRQTEAALQQNTAPVTSTEVTTTSPTVSATGCTVIVGSFKSMANRNELEAQIKAADYEVSSGRLNNGMYYAGVPVACGESPARAALVKRINQVFNVDAWIMQNSRGGR